MDVVASKAALRETIAQKLTLLATEVKKLQSEFVFQKLITSPEYQNAKRISTFLSIDNEIDTEPIVRKIFEDGKECFIPRYRKKEMQMVKLHSMEDWETLPVNSWNIKQPKFSEEREDALSNGGLDLMVIPGVAFTSDGFRLGHGGGYYDSYLRRLKESQKYPATIAVAFKEQIVDELPTTERDVQINTVLYKN